MQNSKYIPLKAKIQRKDKFEDCRNCPAHDQVEGDKEAIYCAKHNKIIKRLKP